jgi:hypothetical protein
MSASSAIRALAADLEAAGLKMRAAAQKVVQREAADIENDAKSIQDPIVVTFPGGTSAHLAGTERRGVSQELSGAPSLAGVDLGGHADSLAASLLDEGVGVITSGQ